MMTSIGIEMEKKHREKSIKTSVIIHVLILLLAWLLVLPSSPKKPDNEKFAVAVEFIDFKPSSLSKVAHDDPGKMRPKEEVKKVEPVKVEKVEVVTKPKVDIPKPEPKIEPQVIDPIISEILEEDSELEAIEEEIEIEEPEEEVVPAPEIAELEEIEEEIMQEEAEEAEEEPAEVAEVSEEVGEAADEPSNPSSLDGSEGGTGKSDEGDGAGASSGDDGDEGKGDSGAGTGEYDGSGDGVFGRQVIYRNLKGVYALGDDLQSGKVVVYICINPAGIATYAEIDEEATTITSAKVLRKYLEAARGYKYEKDLSAPDEQCGKLSFSIDRDEADKNAFVASAKTDITKARQGGRELENFKRKYNGFTPDQVKRLTKEQWKKHFKNR